MKTLFKWLLGLLCAAALGGGSALYALERVARFDTQSIGPWRVSTTAGSPASGLYERAAIAVHALFVLGREETLYYRAHTDANGRALDGRCDYLLRGKAPDARWWSITAYGRDDYLIPNPEHRYSYTARNLTFETDGSYLLRVSPFRTDGNWLPVVDKQPFSLTLRLYVPSAQIVAQPELATLPTIEALCK